MGLQTSLASQGGNAHKDIFFNGHYHDALYKGNKLFWKKNDRSIKFHKVYTPFGEKPYNIYSNFIAGKNYFYSFYSNGRTLFAYRLNEHLAFTLCAEKAFWVPSDPTGTVNNYVTSCFINGYFFLYLFSHGGCYMFKMKENDINVQEIKEVSLFRTGEVSQTITRPNISKMYNIGNGYCMVSMSYVTNGKRGSFAGVTNDFINFREILPDPRYYSPYSACYCPDKCWRIIMYCVENGSYYFKTYCTDNFSVFTEDSDLMNSVGFIPKKIQKIGRYTAIYGSHENNYDNGLRKYTQDFSEFTDEIPLLAKIQDVQYGEHYIGFYGHNKNFASFYIAGTSRLSIYYGRYVFLIADSEFTKITGAVDMCPNFGKSSAEHLTEHIQYASAMEMTDREALLLIKDGKEYGYSWVTLISLTEDEEHV